MSKKKGLVIPISVEMAIAALEQRLEKLELEFAEEQTEWAAWLKADAEWEERVQNVASMALKDALNDKNRKVTLDLWSARHVECDPSRVVVAKINAEFALPADFPAAPIRPDRGIRSDTYDHMKTEIEQAIRLLNMTDAKTIPASMVAELTQYL